MVDALVLETNKVFCVGSSPSVLKHFWKKRHSEIGITIVSEAIIIGSNPVVSNKKNLSLS